MNEQEHNMLLELGRSVSNYEDVIIPDTAILGEFCVLLDSSSMDDALFYYHGDHLSSTAIVTDAYANVVQAVLYAPFGEVIHEYNAYWMLDTIPRYLFNGKELDEESGMYYYSARYYSPPSFISRDPHFEDYPTLSPYNYCSNNPVKRIDPDGKEDYEVDVANKKITVVKGTEGSPDRFIVKKENGETICSKSYDNGTIKKLDSKIEAYAVTGDNNGKEMFEFLAKNTGNEWAHFQTGEGGEDGTNYLFTSFSVNSVSHDYNVMEGKIRGYNHNHPNGSTSPSDADKNVMLECQRYNYSLEGRFPNKGSAQGMPASYIYTNDGNYTPFDPKTKALYETLNQFNPIQMNKKP